MKYIKKYEHINEKSNFDDIFVGNTLGDILKTIGDYYDTIKDIKIVECESFITEDEAIKYLQNNGYSIGRTQGYSPKGIKYGKVDIQKWRNLDEDDILKLDGVLLKIENEYFILFFTYQKAHKYNI
jgi:hypothetical protein